MHFRLNSVVYTFLFYVQVPYYSLNNFKLITDRARGFLCKQIKKVFFSYELRSQPVVMSCIRHSVHAASV